MNYPDWIPNLVVVSATVLAILAAVLLHYEALQWLSRRLARSEGRPRRKVLNGLLFLLGTHIVEIWGFGLVIWGLLHVPGAGAVAGVDTRNLLDMVYLSAATFTTVGFGDLAPVGPIRFLAGTEALTGFMLITWSASFLYLEMERYWRAR